MQQSFRTERRFTFSAHRMKTLRAKSCTQIVSTPPPWATLPRCPTATDTASNHRLFLDDCKTRQSGQPLQVGEIVGLATQEATEYSLGRLTFQSAKHSAANLIGNRNSPLASQPFRRGIRIQHHLEYVNGPRLPCREHRPRTRHVSPCGNSASTQAPLPDFSV